MTRAGWFRLGAAVLALAVLVPGAVLGWFWYQYEWPYGTTGAPVMLSIEEGATASSIARVLEREGLVRRASLFVRFVRWTHREKDLQAGEYRFDRPVSVRGILDTLRKDSPAVQSVTIPEGLPLEEVAAAIAKSGVASQKDLERAFRDPAPVRALDPRAPDLEGYLFPGTYRLSPGVAPARVAAALVRAFQKRYATPEAGRLARAGRPLREIVTLASLVEEETARPEERARIAGVFLARLARGMKLQCDPTVAYAARRAGRWTGTIRRKDLEHDDPYNTYTREGLPPGPIVSPGLASLKAVLDPVRGGDLYFVSRGDGTHVFAASLEAHHRNVRRFTK